MSKDQAEQNGGEPQPHLARGEGSWTEVGYGFALWFVALLLICGPRYLFGESIPGQTESLVLTVVSYAFALLCAVLGLAFFRRGAQKTPEVR